MFQEKLSVPESWYKKVLKLESDEQFNRKQLKVLLEPDSQATQNCSRQGSGLIKEQENNNLFEKKRKTVKLQIRLVAVHPVLDQQAIAVILITFLQCLANLRLSVQSFAELVKQTNLNRRL